MGTECISTYCFDPAARTLGRAPRAIPCVLQAQSEGYAAPEPTAKPKAPTHPFPDYFKSSPKAFKNITATSPCRRARRGQRRGGAGWELPCPRARAAALGLGAKVQRRKAPAGLSRGSPSAGSHTDKCRKQNSAALGHLEEIQSLQAAGLTINTLVILERVFVSV